MRPRTIQDFVGNESILSEESILRKAINLDKVGNLIFHGPPGVGKTTLAKIIASNTRSYFSELSAVMSGMKEIKQVILDAKERMNIYSLKTTVFIDEIHRFNISQQDALLPWVENGLLTIIGATTENPNFSINNALLSRVKVFMLRAVPKKDLSLLITRAIEDSDNGYGNKKINLSQEARKYLIDKSNGDARCLYNAFELLVETTNEDSNGVLNITLEIAEDLIQEKAIFYDKSGDIHFNTISAFIKSIRGSDANAALFWLARMIEGGEDPRYIFRRLLIAASEDIGLADPNAIIVVNSCAISFDRVGLPEGVYFLSQATIYLAVTKKSNSVKAIFNALNAVKGNISYELPSHLRDKHNTKGSKGNISSYVYPHDFEENWVPQQYLPDSFKDSCFWEPSIHGWEGSHREDVFLKRSAQLNINKEDEVNIRFQKLEDIFYQKNNGKNDIFTNTFNSKLNQITFENNDNLLIFGFNHSSWLEYFVAENFKSNIYIFLDENDIINVNKIRNYDSNKRNLITIKYNDFIQLSEEIKFKIITGKVDFNWIKKFSDYKFLNKLKKHSDQDTLLCLCLNQPILGPLNLINQIINKKNSVKLDNIDIQKAILHEKQQLDISKNLDEFAKNLGSLGCKIKLDTSNKESEIDINENIIKRWFAENSEYKKSMLSVINNNELNYISNLLRAFVGRKLLQKLLIVKILAIFKEDFV